MKAHSLDKAGKKECVTKRQTKQDVAVDKKTGRDFPKGKQERWRKKERQPFLLTAWGSPSDVHTLSLTGITGLGLTGLSYGCFDKSYIRIHLSEMPSADAAKRGGRRDWRGEPSRIMNSGFFYAFTLQGALPSEPALRHTRFVIIGKRKVSVREDLVLISSNN